MLETTRLTDDEMPEFNCHCECSKCPSTATRSNIQHKPSVA